MSSIQDKKILVTGADGFIGSHLVERLVQDGWQVRAFVFYTSFGTWGWLDTLPADVLNNIEVIPGDIRDPNGVAEAVRGCFAVLHLAALIGIPYSYIAPDSYVETNIKGTLNILQAARQHGTERIVHTSTSEVYGTARFIPMTEEHPLSAQSPYAATKIAADQLAASYACSFGLPVTILRPFNTYGPRQSNRAVIPTVITQIAAGNRRIVLGNTAPVRDFNYVLDTADAYLAVLRAEQSVGQTLQTGTGTGFSILETVQAIANVMRTEVEIVQSAERLRPSASEVMRLVADSSRLQALTGWRPRYAGREGFLRGLEETVQWFTTSGNLKKYAPQRYGI